QLVGFTRHTSKARLEPQSYGRDLQSEFIRFDNIDENPDPQNLQLTWLSLNGDVLRVAIPGNPMSSWAEEPSMVLLPDNRIFCTMRTSTGRIWYSVSSDDGLHWSKPEPLRYEDGGAEILQPIAPCPIYALRDGRYLL